MAKGQTVSVTLPKPVIKFYDNKAKELGTSRSKVLGMVIIQDFEKEMAQAEDEKKE